MIHHVGLEVEAADVAPCIEFWRLLGWRQIAQAEGIADGAWLAKDGQHIHLQVIALPVAPHVGHVALVDADVDQRADGLAAAGYEVLERTRYWGARRIFTRCPAGHRVEIMSAPPAG